MAGTAIKEMRPVVFRNKEGLALHGILHMPSGTPRQQGIIILSPGIKSRVAPHRLYVKMSRRFVELGYAVLRFDPAGMGDSEGEIDERFAADVYGSIQVGRFVGDTVAAMDWMQRELGIKSFILSGLCGGAITGLLAGAGDNRVDSLLGLGIPVILDGASVDRTRHMSKGQLEEMRRGYLRKALDPKAWTRLLSFKSDYRLLMKSLALTLSGKKKKPMPAGVTGKAAVPGNFNTLFPDAFSRMAEKGKVCLVFSEADRLYWEFEEKFAATHRDSIARAGKNLEIHITKNANHVFTFRDWQESALETMCSWLERQDA
ncbi:MAG: hypothetical protein QY316_12055 [Thermodesulfobacteriota bacterium]|nr:MAG: hypothetical protein QY316_12055 [Thermodesulfobacteriota bacterium]